MRLPWLALGVVSCALPPDAVLCYYGCEVGERLVLERTSAWCDLRIAEARAACGLRDDDLCRALEPPCDARPGCEAVRLVLCASGELGAGCADLSACRTRGIVERKTP